MLPHNVHMAAVRNLSDESLLITCTYAFNRYEQLIPISHVSLGIFGVNHILS